jgi:Flp pilus assembly protein TadG
MLLFIRIRCHYLRFELQRTLDGFFHDRSGVVVILVALAAPVLIGTMGLAADVSYWYMHKRSMQNAADVAAIAAASTTSNYAAEAKAVAAQLGFKDGSGNIKVTAVPTNTAGCPANQNCYTVTVSDTAPSFFSQVINYTGNSSTKGVTAISASSVATSGPAYPYCILALNGQVSNDFTTNGSPKADLAGCNIMANSNATCHGHNLNANIGDAHGTNSGCGNIQHSNMPTVGDPYAGLRSNIPLDTCGGNYPQKPQNKKKDQPLPASNQLSGKQKLERQRPLLRRRATDWRYNDQRLKQCSFGDL